MSQNRTLTRQEILELYNSFSKLVEKLNAEPRSTEEQKPEVAETEFVDSTNALYYILFVLMFYAFSIVVLMIKYIRREREGSKLEYYYNEFVKREWYKDKNHYDKSGRRIRYDVQGTKVTRKRPTGLRRFSVFDLDDNSESGAGTTAGSPPVSGSGSSVSEESEECAVFERKATQKKGKRSVMLCVGAASLFTETAILGVATLNAAGGEDAKKAEVTEVTEVAAEVKAVAEDEEDKFKNTGARPKRSSLKASSKYDEERSEKRQRARSSASARKEGIEANGLENILEHRDSLVEDYEAAPVQNKLMFTKVDETVRRVQSLPLRRVSTMRKQKDRSRRKVESVHFFVEDEDHRKD